ncbi:unnamed protein product, partial [Closterium sp. NIES-53]
IPSRFAQVDYRALKKILKRCLSSRAHGDGIPACAPSPPEDSSKNAVNSVNPVDVINSVNFDAVKPAAGCPHCDDEFFKLLEEELRSIERSFTREAARVISCHNAHGLSAILSRFSDYSKPEVMYCAASSLLEHLALSYLATRKIVKKYVKVHSAPVKFELSKGDESDVAESDGYGGNGGSGGNAELCRNGGNAERLEGIRLLQQRILRSPLMLELTALLSNLSYALEQKQLKLQLKQQQQQQQQQRHQGCGHGEAGSDCSPAPLTRGERREQQQRQQLFGCSHRHLHRHCHDPRCPGFDPQRSKEHCDRKWRYQHLRWLHILTPMQSTWTGGGSGASGVFSGRLPWSPAKGAGEEGRGPGQGGAAVGRSGDSGGGGSPVATREVEERVWSDDEDGDEEEVEVVHLTECGCSLDLFEGSAGSLARDQVTEPQLMAESGGSGAVAGGGGGSGGMGVFGSGNSIGSGSQGQSSSEGALSARVGLGERGLVNGCSDGEGGGGGGGDGDGAAAADTMWSCFSSSESLLGDQSVGSENPMAVASDGTPERLPGQEQQQEGEEEQQQQQQQSEQQHGGLEQVLELQLRPEFHAHVEFKCPVCLDVFFDPIALACGHIYCRSCASSVAKVAAFEDIRMASPHITCPVCRQADVFGGMVSLRELHRLIMARQPEQWRERRDEELKQRLAEARKYMDEQMRVALRLH